MKLTLFPPCSRTGPSLSRQWEALAYFCSPRFHDLVIWTDDAVSFPLGNGGSVVLANCTLCGAKTSFSFFGKPKLFKFSPETQNILQAFCWSRYHQKVCRFSSPLLRHSLYSWHTILSSVFYLKLSGRSGRNHLLFPPFLSGYNGPPNVYLF